MLARPAVSGFNGPTVNKSVLLLARQMNVSLANGIWEPRRFFSQSMIFPPTGSLLGWKGKTALIYESKFSFTSLRTSSYSSSHESLRLLFRDPSTLL